MQMSQNRLDDGRVIKTHIAFLFSLLKDTPYRIKRLVSIFFSFIVGCECLSGRIDSKSIKNHRWGLPGVGGTNVELKGKEKDTVLI